MAVMIILQSNKTDSHDRNYFVFNLLDLQCTLMLAFMVRECMFL